MTVLVMLACLARWANAVGLFNGEHVHVLVGSTRVGWQLLCIDVMDQRYLIRHLPPFLLVQALTIMLLYAYT